MLEELAVGVITPDRYLKRYWWRSTITSPVGLGLLGLDFAEYAWKFDEVAVSCLVWARRSHCLRNSRP